MSDIVERLRAYPEPDWVQDMCREAATEIERLRRTLNDYRIANDKAADEIEALQKRLKDGRL